MSGHAPERWDAAHNKRLPPLRVWICWCDACGEADYAYGDEPTASGAGCPRCETGPEYKKIAGPYDLTGQKRRKEPHP